MLISSALRAWRNPSQLRGAYGAFQHHIRRDILRMPGALSNIANLHGSTVNASATRIPGFFGRIFGRILSSGLQVPSAFASRIGHSLLYSGFGATFYAHTMRPVRCDHTMLPASTENSPRVGAEVSGFKVIVGKPIHGMTQTSPQSPVDESVGECSLANNHDLSDDASQVLADGCENSDCDQTRSPRDMIFHLMKENADLHRRVKSCITSELCEREARLLCEEENRVLLERIRRLEDAKNRAECSLDEVRHQLTCVVCMVEPINQYFPSCGHAVCCEKCAVQMHSPAQDWCPVCRSSNAISQRLPLYGFG